MTLGELIRELAGIDPKKPVYFEPLRLVPTKFSSYRGYYEQLALGYEVRGSKRAGELLADCRAALATNFEGYKGGTYDMRPNTPLWASNYGDASGWEISGIKEDEYEVLLRVKPEDDWP